MLDAFWSSDKIRKAEMERKQEFFLCQIVQFMNTHPQPLGILGRLTCSGCQGAEHVSECNTQGGENRKPQVRPSEKHGAVDVNGYHICTHTWPYHKHAHSAASFQQVCAYTVVQARTHPCSAHV